MIMQNTSEKKAPDGTKTREEMVRRLVVTPTLIFPIPLAVDDRVHDRVIEGEAGDGPTD